MADIPPDLLVGRPVYRCARGHEQHEPVACTSKMRRGQRVKICLRPVTLHRHEPSALGLALRLRDTAREEYARDPTPVRESLVARMEQRLVEAAVEAGLSWDEARKL